jgi:hypothetical protein
MDISVGEFGNAMTTLQQKFIVGVHLEKVHNDKLSFSGIPSNQQTITVRINCGSTATTAVLNMQLILIVDAVLVIDFESQTTKLSFM